MSGFQSRYRAARYQEIQRPNCRTDMKMNPIQKSLIRFPQCHILVFQFES